MKKFLALLLAVLMIASMSVTAFAADADSSQGSGTPQQNIYADNTADVDPTEASNKDVYVTADAVGDEKDIPTVYHIVVKWKDLQFTFEFTKNVSEVLWQPHNHTYTDQDGNALEGNWVAGTDITVDNNGTAAEKKATQSEAITVENHSNAAVTVTATTNNVVTNGVTTTVALATNDSNSLLSAVGYGMTADEIICKYDVTVTGTPNIVSGFTANKVTLKIEPTV